jgi:hypothetical protein
MRFRAIVPMSFVFLSVAALLFAEITPAQAPGRPTATPAARAAGAYAPQGTLIQVMRGILLPSSNVLFFAQSNDPSAVPKADDPSLAVNPLASTYGGWTAVENSAIAISEAANLLMIPGRVCSNGKPVPLQNPDWAKFVQGLRDAGMEAYKAAQAKSQDQIVDVSDKVSTACSNCHDVYREKTAAQGGLSARCTK